MSVWLFLWKRPLNCFRIVKNAQNNEQSLVFDRHNEDYKAPTTSYQEI